VQEELLRLAQQADGSPLVGAKLDEITFADGEIRRRDGREMSLADAMRVARVERIEKEVANTRTLPIRRYLRRSRSTSS
jgi:hypothetical protein